MSSDEIILLDAAGIGVDTSPPIVLDASEHALLDMLGGDSPSLSLWQKNLRALRAEREFGFQTLRDGAVAVISSVTV